MNALFEIRKAFSHDRVITGKEEWLTPPEIKNPLGEFDLDPCSPVNRPWPTAKYHYTIEDNGLLKPWFGRVWLNPPYGNKTAQWMARLADHGNGIALIFARTETRVFFPHVWERASGILFLKGRIKFLNVDGSKPKNGGGAPSCLIAYGANNFTALEQCGLAGRLVPL